MDEEVRQSQSLSTRLENTQQIKVKNHPHQFIFTHAWKSCLHHLYRWLHQTKHLQFFKILRWSDICLICGKFSLILDDDSIHQKLPQEWRIIFITETTLSPQNLKTKQKKKQQQATRFALTAESWRQWRTAEKVHQILPEIAPRKF